MTLLERDKQAIWHPYMDTRLYGNPIPIIRAEKSNLIDENGTVYIDAIASWWTNIHGHSHPHIAATVAKQIANLDHVIFSGFTHQPAIELAERLLKRLPSNIQKIFFSDNGSTAVEVAIKIALQYYYNQGKPNTPIIAFKQSYHGDTFGAMSVSSRSAFTKPFDQFLFDVHFITVPVKGFEEQAFAELQNAIEILSPAAFIFEPLVQGTAGMVMYEPSILDQMIACCKQNNVITIADEVMTGFGRTGKFFASEYLSNKADLFCLSKGLTGGTMAMGVTAASIEIYNHFLNEPTQTLFHGHSYTANPIACSTALASLDIFDQGHVFTDIQRISELHAAFVSKHKNHPRIKDIRSRGTILAIDLQTIEKQGYFNEIRNKAYAFFISKRVLMRPLGNVIYVLPPYCISTTDLQYVYQTIELFLDTI